jgi:prepilin-type N-terminal cleavage/methylation domain-containing protein
MQRIETQRRSAFSLIEIMVVLAVAALLAAMTLGTFSSVRSNNKRQGCQTNLNQIYTAFRQYARDYDGRAPYRDTANTGDRPGGFPDGGEGLNLLYAYPNDTRTGYMRTISSLHCPAHQVADTENAFVAGTETPNPLFNSYQVQDVLANAPTYEVFRSSSVSTGRQLFPHNSSGLLARPPADDTIITWCQWHRKLDNTGNPVASDDNKDIVLFYDGTIRTLPINTDARSTPNPDPNNEQTTDGAYCAVVDGVNCMTGWQRRRPPSF